jgi:hypothetical protein
MVSGISKNVPPIETPFTNIKYLDIFPVKPAYQLPNYTRQSFLKSLWEAQFHGRTFLFFGKSWMNILCLTAFLYMTSIFGTTFAIFLIFVCK